MASPRRSARLNRMALSAVTVLALALGLGLWRASAGFRPAPSVVPATASGATSASSAPVFHPAGLRRLTYGAACAEFPSFRPDGQSIVYSEVTGPVENLRVLGIGGGEPRALTHMSGWNYAPRLSPDGRSIATPAAASSASVTMGCAAGLVVVMRVPSLAGRRFREAKRGPMRVGPVTASARRPSISAGGGPGIAESEAGVAGSGRGRARSEARSAGRWWGRRRSDAVQAVRDPRSPGPATDSTRIVAGPVERATESHCPGPVTPRSERRSTGSDSPPAEIDPPPAGIVPGSAESAAGSTNREAGRGRRRSRRDLRGRRSTRKACRRGSSSAVLFISSLKRKAEPKIRDGATSILKKVWDGSEPPRARSPRPAIPRTWKKSSSHAQKAPSPIPNFRLCLP
jgi:WD40-like Beta Propeller Repeat